MADPEVKIEIETEDEGSQEAFKRVQSELKKTEKQAENTEDSAKELREELKKTGDQAEDTEQKAKELRKELERTGDQAQQTEDEVEQLGDEIEQTGDEATKTKKKVEGLGDEIEQTGDEATKTKKKVEQLGDEIEQTGDEAIQAKNKVKGLADETEKGGDKANKTATNYDRLSKRTRDLGDETSKAEKHMEMLRIEAEKSAEGMRRLQERTQIVGKEIADLRNPLKLVDVGMRNTGKGMRESFASAHFIAVEFTWTMRQLYRVMQRNIKGFLDAAASMQTFEKTLTVTEGSAEAAASRLAHLTETAKTLVGIDLQALIKYNAILRAGGLEAERVDSVLESVAKSMAELGKPVEVTRRLLEQFSQAINGNRIEALDFKTILSELPQFLPAARRAFGEGVTVIEDFRNAVSKAGLSPKEGILQVIEELNRSAKGIGLENYRAQTEKLSETFFQMQAQLGEHLLPLFIRLISRVTALLDWFIELDDSTQDLIAHTALAATAFTGLVVVAGVLTVAIGVLNASLVALIGVGLTGVLAALAPFAPVIALVIAGVVGLGYAIFRLKKSSEDATESLDAMSKESTRLMRNTNAATRSLNIATDSTNNFAEKIRQAEEETASLSTTIDVAKRAITDMSDEANTSTEQIDKLDNSSSNLNETLKATAQEVTQTGDASKSTKQATTCLLYTSPSPRD